MYEVSIRSGHGHRTGLHPGVGQLRPVGGERDHSSELGREEEDDVALKLCLAAADPAPLQRCAVPKPHHLPSGTSSWLCTRAARSWRSSNTYTGSMQTQDPLKATGKLHPHGSGLPRVMRRTACIVLKEATKVGFKRMGDLASVWCELEL